MFNILKRDEFGNWPFSAASALSVTPNDTTDISNSKGTTKGIYLGAAGNVKVDMADGSTVTFTALSAGVIHLLAVKRVYLTGTTATGIVALY